MTAVVDANVAVKWFVRQDGSDLALRLQADDRLLAPGMIVSEVTTTLWRYVAGGYTPADDARDAVAVLPRYFHEIVDDRRLAERAIAIALELGYPPYDFFYLALALERDTVLVTADKRLVNRLAGTPYSASVTLLTDWTP